MQVRYPRAQRSFAGNCRRACALLLLGFGLTALGAEIRPFGVDSLARIRQAHQDRAFVLVLWAQSCHFCMQHLQEWGALQKRYPAVPIVLVNTDPVVDQPGLAALLRQRKLDRLEHHAFADDNHARLRWSIDPKWYGELPRVYLFDRQHDATAISGMQDMRVIDVWLQDKQRALRPQRTPAVAASGGRDA